MAHSGKNTTQLIQIYLGHMLKVKNFEEQKGSVVAALRTTSHMPITPGVSKLPFMLFLNGLPGRNLDQ